MDVRIPERSARPTEASSRRSAQREGSYLPMRAAAPVAADVRLLAAAALLLVAWEFAALDLPLARIYGGAQGFAWRDAWFVSALLHDAARWLSAACLALLAWDALRPAIPAGGPPRSRRLYWLAVVIVTLVAVPGLKRLSLTSCPWDLAEFGGVAAYVPHWMLRAGDGGPGHCFPAGHPVSAFTFIGVYYLWRPYRPVFARRLLVVLVAAGALLGWSQMARGAHFASHTLWSAWLCWAISVGADALANRPQAAPA